jgi:mRNA interferase RelE/StbE
LAWKVSFLIKARKQLESLDQAAQKRILNFLFERLLASPDPRLLGKTLVGELEGLIRYRVGDYRLICRLEDRALTILVIEVGHRREIYR